MPKKRKKLTRKQKDLRNEQARERRRRKRAEESFQRELQAEITRYYAEQERIRKAEKRRQSRQNKRPLPQAKQRKSLGQIRHDTRRNRARDEGANMSRWRKWAQWSRDAANGEQGFPDDILRQIREFNRKQHRPGMSKRGFRWFYHRYVLGESEADSVLAMGNDT